MAAGSYLFCYHPSFGRTLCKAGKSRKALLWGSAEGREADPQQSAGKPEKDPRDHPDDPEGWG